MGGTDWLGHNWFALVQTGAILCALAFTGAGFFFDARARRVGNLIRLTDRHRLLWERMYSDPKLARILDPTVRVDRAPVTAEEELFVVFLILHLANSYYTVRSGFLTQPEGVARDIRLFFGLPIPKAVWQKVRGLQDRQFVKFVERCLARPRRAPSTAADGRKPRPPNAPRSDRTTKSHRRS
ncbi:MAG: hypothetical protein ACYDH9_15200 [Limisphaerales bacterium]